MTTHETSFANALQTKVNSYSALLQKAQYRADNESETQEEYLSNQAHVAYYKGVIRGLSAAAQMHKEVAR